MSSAYIHPTAVVEKSAALGQGTRVWHFCHVREGAVIGDDCQLGHSVYVDVDVRIGDGCRIQNHASIFKGVSLGARVFVGPSAVFTNDLRPRAGNREWTLTPTLVGEGATIGANATIVCGVTIGEWAMIGAGSVVTRDVAPYTLVVGSPARSRGWVCRCGETVPQRPTGACPHLRPA